MSPRARRKLLVAVAVLGTMVITAGCKGGSVGDDLVKAGKTLADGDAARIAGQFDVEPEVVRSAGQQLDTGAAANVVRTGQDVDNTEEGWRLLKVACQMSDTGEYLTADTEGKRRLIIQAQGSGDEAAIAKIGLMADDLAEAKSAVEATTKMHAAIMCAIADNKAGT